MESYYSQISNFEQLGDVLKIRAQLTQRLTTTEDYTYSYFYVGFWGKSFPSSVQVAIVTLCYSRNVFRTLLLCIVVKSWSDLKIFVVV